LKNILPFEFKNGTEQLISEGKTVSGLIAEGSVQEDSPATRVLHHFHDPTLTWDQAGLRFLGVPLGNSSVVWSQMSPQGACCGNFAWKDARNAYFNALTSTTESQRTLWYAKTFRTLGHLIHHVQDAAVPSHTRNDVHLQPFRTTQFPDGDPFHHWADSETGIAQINSVTQALRFGSSILSQSSANPHAPVPFARIIDKTDGDFGVLSPNLNIGLAEYSNANFISKGTAQSTDYLYPIYSQLEFGAVETLPNGKKVRYARFRPGFGEQNYRVGLSSRMAQFVSATAPPDAIDFGLDNNVHDDYGKKLFPRAIGYSAGLIDYFFRARIAVSTGILSFAPENFAYVNAFFMPNDSSETMTGNFYALAKYADEQQQSSVAQWNGISLAPGEWAFLCLSSAAESGEPCIFANQESQPSVEMSQCAPFSPPPVRMKQFTIVFRGDLGEEKDVGVGVGTYEDCGDPPQ
jgi:hypothetical protein